jgi:glucosamine-6-phosphate deaminase
VSDRDFRVDRLRVVVHPEGRALAGGIAAMAAEVVRRAIESRGTANVMFASGNSQLTFLEMLPELPIDWGRIVGFHMDEYLDLSPEHPASFRRYMHERVVAPLGLTTFHEIEGDAPDPQDECDRYAALLDSHPLDLCCLGIGENGHLAFNDPPVADFDDPRDVKIVTLDDACRRQQVGEGHFATVADVPPRAITVTIPALMRAGRVLAVAPGTRKADPVRRALEGPVETSCPASILRRHPDATLHLDPGSVSKLAEVRT